MKCPACQSVRTKVIVKKLHWKTDIIKEYVVKYLKCLKCGNIEVLKD